jgi:hypothetical protein
MISFHDSASPHEVASTDAELPVGDYAAPGTTVARTRATKAYVVQVALSVVAFDPRSVPRLDVFDSYHLYSDISLENGLMRNALRLGFFTEARAAKALASYLASHFDSPRVMQVDAAEEARSVHHKFVACKDVGGDSGTHLAIEVVAPRPLPTSSQKRRPRAVPRHQTAVRSLWSRLVGNLAGSEMG